MFGNGVLSEGPSFFILWGTQNIVYSIGFAVFQMWPLSPFHVLALTLVIGTQLVAMATAFIFLKAYDIQKISSKC